MIELLTLLAKAMRTVILGPNPPGTVEALRAAGIAAADLSPEQTALVDKSVAFKAHLDNLATAVLTGKTYCQIIGPELAAKTHNKVKQRWDEACQFTPTP